jgi:2-oxoisovalerate dehydrogenase E2 component (dihydrolipoyl transacylase)
VPRQLEAPDWVALRPVERAMARRMALAGTLPVAAQWIQLEVGAALARVKELRAADVPATFNALVVHAVAAGLERFPAMAAELDYEDFRKRTPERARIGVAVASQRGLVVPTLEVTGDLSDTATRLSELVTAVRAGASDRSLFEGAHFTITNIGPVGIHGGFPIPSPGQPGILGVSSVWSAAIVRDNAVTVGEVCNMTVSIDHRAVDGITAARFVRFVGDVLENAGDVPATEDVSSPAQKT